MFLLNALPLNVDSFTATKLLLISDVKVLTCRATRFSIPKESVTLNLTIHSGAKEDLIFFCCAD